MSLSAALYIIYGAGLPVFLNTWLPFSYTPPTKKQNLIRDNAYLSPQASPVLRYAGDARLDFAQYDYASP
jgi:hypothetical protein